MLRCSIKRALSTHFRHIWPVYRVPRRTRVSLFVLRYSPPAPSAGWRACRGAKSPRRRGQGTVDDSCFGARNGHARARGGSLARLFSGSCDRWSLPCRGPSLDLGRPCPHQPSRGHGARGFLRVRSGRYGQGRSRCACDCAPVRFRRQFGPGWSRPQAGGLDRSA